MKVKVNVGFVDEMEHRRERLLVNDDLLMSINPLDECPEDAYIGRSLPSCIEISRLMKMAYIAGTEGEPFDLDVEFYDPDEETGDLSDDFEGM